MCLKCRLSGTGEAISSFGHPYIRSGPRRQYSGVLPPPPSLSRICTQVPAEWQEQSDPKSSLLPLVHSIVVYCLDHSSESEAVDLLMEIDCVSLLKDLVKEDTYQRVCLYLTRSVGIPHPPTPPELGVPLSLPTAVLSMSRSQRTASCSTRHSISIDSFSSTLMPSGWL